MENIGRGRLIFYLLMFFAMMGWGASWVHVKYLSGYMQIHEIIFYRYLITAVSMIPVLFAMKIPFKISLKEVLYISIASVIMIVYTWLFIAGTKLGTAGLGGAFVTTLIPIMTFVLSAALGRKKISLTDTSALILGAIGVLTILNIWSFDARDIFRLENLYFVTAALSWAVLTIFGGGITHRVNPMSYSFYLYLIVTIIEGFFLTDFNTHITKLNSAVYINIFMLAIISTTFATSVYFTGAKKIGANKASSFTFLVPFSAIGLSALFLGEEISFGMIIGTIMALGAVKILNKKRY